MSNSAAQPSNDLATALKAAGLAVSIGLFAAVLVRTAWHTDDAYITYRTVDNFVHGHGLRWNVAERVQAYTHPLWMLLLSAAHFVTREIHVTALVVSIACAVGSVALLLARIAVTPAAAALAFTGLVCSNAFVDFGTGGLENPLTSLLLACFVARYYATEDRPGELFGLSLIAALAALNRVDTLAFFGPALAWRWWRRPTLRGLLSGAAGFLPVAAWLVFSLVYYGFLVPNTAFAKLNTGVPQLSMLQQGFGYYLSTFDRDPQTLALILIGLAAPLLVRDRAGLALAAGVLIYLVYIVRIGGDFMQGRFFTGPALVAAALLARAPWRWRELVPAAGGIVLLFLTGPYPAALQGEDYGQDRWNMGARPPHAPFLDERYVKDERGLDFPFTGLLRMRHTGWEPSHRWVEEGKRYSASAKEEVRVHGAIGWKGFYAGPSTFIIDYYALSDPLLARLPAADQRTWLIGHFQRDVPEGYAESVESGENKIADPGVAAYYGHLCTIARGPIWSAERWRTIWAMNTGQYEPLLDAYRARYLRRTP